MSLSTIVTLLRSPEPKKYSFWYNPYMSAARCILGMAFLFVGVFYVGAFISLFGVPGAAVLLFAAVLLGAFCMADGSFIASKKRAEYKSSFKRWKERELACDWNKVIEKMGYNNAETDKVNSESMPKTGEKSGSLNFFGTTNSKVPGSALPASNTGDIPVSNTTLQK